MKPTTIADVKQFREEHKCSLREARDSVRRRNMISAIEDAKTIDDLRPVLLVITQLATLRS
jgi:hypothetical protein